MLVCTKCAVRCRTTMRGLKALLRLCTLWFASSDLPVHCLRHQVAGRWTYFIGPRHLSPQSCGHHSPGTIDDVAHGGNVLSARLGGNVVRIELALERPDLVRTLESSLQLGFVAGEVGWWTMVYDEGTEVRIGGHALFAFSRIEASPLKAGEYVSRCDSSAMGWYRYAPPMSNHSSGQDVGFGCFYAVRHGSNAVATDEPSPHRHGSDAVAPDEPSPYPVASNQRVPPPTLRSIRNDSAAATVSQGMRSWPIGSMARAGADLRPDALKYAGLPAAWDWRDVDGVDYVSPVRSQGTCGSCYASATVSMLESRLAIASGGLERPQLSVQDVLSCSAYSQGCGGGFPYLVGKYLTDHGVVSEQCFPTAAADASNAMSCDQRCSTTTGNSSSSGARRWRASDYRYVGGRYGGCSEVAMMEEIYSNGPVVAGFEASAELYAHDGVGVFAASPNTAPAGPPSTAVILGPGVGHSVSSPSGGDAADALPQTVELSANSGTWARDGRTADAEEEEEAGLAAWRQRPKEFETESEYLQESERAPLQMVPPSRLLADGFQTTNHAVLVVGWGMYEGTKYWWAQNTWGASWGDGGFFRMLRGSDNAAFESMVVAVDVEGASPLRVPRGRRRRSTAAETGASEGKGGYNVEGAIGSPSFDDEDSTSSLDRVEDLEGSRAVPPAVGASFLRRLRYRWRQRAALQHQQQAALVPVGGPPTTSSHQARAHPISDPRGTLQEDDGQKVERRHATDGQTNLDQLAHWQYGGQ